MRDSQDKIALNWSNLLHGILVSLCFHLLVVFQEFYEECRSDISAIDVFQGLDEVNWVRIEIENIRILLFYVAFNGLRILRQQECLVFFFTASMTINFKPSRTLAIYLPWCLPHVAFRVELPFTLVIICG